MKLFNAIKNINKAVFVISIILIVISYFQKVKLPDKNFISEKLYIDPVQTETKESPFEIKRNEIDYKIVPLYDYELNGLVVSYNDSNNWVDYYHELWKDYINVKDICVVWGENIKNGSYKEASYSSGSFTCRVAYPAGVALKGNALSNNHILYKDEKIYKALKSLDIGDQIHLKGQLVKYSSDNSGWRSSSITRDDDGNGACEVVYVTDFDIIKKGNKIWHDIFDISKYIIVISFALMIVLFIKEPVFRDNDETHWHS